MDIDRRIFREYDIRGVVGEQLTPESVSLTARAIAVWFRRNGARRIAVGYDARASSPELRDILTGELTAAGCHLTLIGMVPTPLLYHGVYTLDVEGGVMITGSHNPADHNGFKICLGKKTLFGPQIQEIRRILESGEVVLASGSSESIDTLDAYLDDVTGRLVLGDRKLKVVVDAGNGMGGLAAVPLYKRLGADVVELYTDPDPSFPNHDPDPSVEDNLADLRRAVIENKADVGIAFDGDGDRLGLVDDKGAIWWGDRLLTLFARTVLAQNPGSIVIAEAKCSQTLFDDIEQRGGIPIMWKAGHSIIKAKMQETGALLAGEMSGHFFFADRYYGFDDACYAGARLLQILSKTNDPLSILLADLPQMVSTPELRVKCSDEKKFEVARQISEHFGADYDVFTIDGARIIFPHGWAIVRPSNTQELLILRFEADTQTHLDEIRREVGSKVAELIG